MLEVEEIESVFTSNIEWKFYQSFMTNCRSTALKNLGIGAIALALSAVVLPFKSNTVVAQDEQNTTVEDLADDGTQLLGQTVTVRGAVEDVELGSTFILKDEDLFGLIDDEEVLVINRSGAMIPIRPQDDIELQVTGRVAQFTMVEAQEYGLDVSLGKYEEYENRTVLIADSIALAPSPDEIFDNPEAYYYKPVAVKGEVENIVGISAFTLEDDELADEILGAEDLLVINVSPLQLPEGDENVVVTGTVRPVVLAEFERDYDLEADDELRTQLEAFAERPVLITTGVYAVE